MEVNSLFTHSHHAQHLPKQLQTHTKKQSNFKVYEIILFIVLAKQNEKKT